MTYDEALEVLATACDYTVDDFRSYATDPDYGLEFKVYPNNQPSQTISYINIQKLLLALSKEHHDTTNTIQD